MLRTLFSGARDVVARVLIPDAASIFKRAWSLRLIELAMLADIILNLVPVVSDYLPWWLTLALLGGAWVARLCSSKTRRHQLPINKIVATKRGKAAIAAAMFAAVLAGGQSYFAEPERPAAVILAMESLIKPWEGLVLKSHWDPFAKIWDICHGETLIDGKPVKPGMSFTAAECEAILEARVKRDYYEPLTKRIKGFTRFPIGVQAAMISGAITSVCPAWSTRPRRGWQCRELSRGMRGPDGLEQGRRPCRAGPGEAPRDGRRPARRRG